MNRNYCMTGTISLCPWRSLNKRTLTEQKNDSGMEFSMPLSFVVMQDALSSFPTPFIGHSNMYAKEGASERQKPFENGSAFFSIGFCQNQDHDDNTGKANEICDRELRMQEQEREQSGTDRLCGGQHR